MSVQHLQENLGEGDLPSEGVSAMHPPLPPPHVAAHVKRQVPALFRR